MTMIVTTDEVDSLWRSMVDYFDQATAISENRGFCDDPLGRMGRAAAFGGAYAYNEFADVCAGYGDVGPWDVDLLAQWCAADPQTRRACVRGLKREDDARIEMVENAVGEMPGIPWAAFARAITESDTPLGSLAAIPGIRTEQKSEWDRWFDKAMRWAVTSNLPYPRWWRANRHPLWRQVPELLAEMTNAERQAVGMWAVGLPSQQYAPAAIAALTSYARRR